MQYHIIVAYKTNSSDLNESLMWETPLIRGAENKHSYIYCLYDLPILVDTWRCKTCTDSSNRL